MNTHYRKILSAVLVGTAAVMCHMALAQSTLEVGYPKIKNASPPSFSPTENKSYNSSTSVVLSSLTPGATIKYTIASGAPSTPTRTLGTAYSSPILVSTTQTIKAFTYISSQPVSTDSAVVQGTYTITPNVLPPSFSPAKDQVYNATTSVTLSSGTPGATIKYTIASGVPSDPTRSLGTTYSGAISVASTQTIKAFAYIPSQASSTDSSISQGTYTITPLPTATTPTFSPNGGSFGAATTVSITSTGFRIKYTTDGTDPTNQGTSYLSPKSVTISTTGSLRAIAVASGYLDSAEKSANFTIGGALVPFPKGVYDLLGSGSAASAAVLAMPYVDGISTRIEWATLRPSAPGINDAVSGGHVDGWSKTEIQWLDTQLLRTANANKDISLRISLGASNGTSYVDPNTGATVGPEYVNGKLTGKKPGWLYREIMLQHIATPSDDNIVMDVLTKDGVTFRKTPVWWGPIYVTRQKELLAFIAGRYSGVVADANMVVPLSAANKTNIWNHIKVFNVALGNNTTNDWDLPVDTDLSGASNTDNARMWAAGYSNKKFIDALGPATGSGVIDAAMDAMPGRYVNFAVGPIAWAFTNDSRSNSDVTYNAVTKKWGGLTVSQCYNDASNNQKSNCVVEQIIANVEARSPDRAIPQLNLISENIPRVSTGAYVGTREHILYNYRTAIRPNSGIGWQMLWSSYPDGPVGGVGKDCDNSLNQTYPCSGHISLRGSVDIGALSTEYQGVYNEIYQSDIENFSDCWTPTGRPTVAVPNPTPLPGATPMNVIIYSHNLMKGDNMSSGCVGGG